MNKNNIQKQLKEEYVEKYDSEYITIRNCGYIVRLTNGWLLAIETPKVQKDWCFGYGMSNDMDSANEKVNRVCSDPEYFRELNLSEIDNNIKCFKSTSARWVISWNNTTSRTIGFPDGHDGAVNYQLTEADKDIICQAYEELKKELNKKINTYLKRYGLSKVRAWSYDQMD